MGIYAAGMILDTAVTAAKKGQELDGEYMGAVVLSGVSIVFVALILLIFFVWLMAKIFDAVNESKKSAEKAAEKKEESAKTAVTEKAPEPKAEAVPLEKAPVTQNGIPEEVVAAITAAVAMLGEETGRTLKVADISRTGGSSSRRGRWGDAAASENTRSIF